MRGGLISMMLVFGRCAPKCHPLIGTLHENSVSTLLLSRWISEPVAEAERLFPDPEPKAVAESVSALPSRDAAEAPARNTIAERGDLLYAEVGKVQDIGFDHSMEASRLEARSACRKYSWIPLALNGISSNRMGVHVSRGMYRGVSPRELTQVSEGERGSTLLDIQIQRCSDQIGP